MMRILGDAALALFVLVVLGAALFWAELSAIVREALRRKDHD